MTTSSLEALLNQVAKRGLRFAGLYEKPAFARGGWRCSLAPSDDNKAPWFNGEAKTPERAIGRALDAAEKHTIKRRPADLDDIL